MIQVLFFLHLFLQLQSVAAQAADSAKVLLSRVSMRKTAMTSTTPWSNFAKLQNWIHLRREFFSASATPI
jgi:hypothetical protein